MLKEEGIKLLKSFEDFLLKNEDTVRNLQESLKIALKMIELLPGKYEIWKSPISQSLVFGLYLFLSGRLIASFALLRFSLEALVQLHYLSWNASKRNIQIDILISKYLKTGRAFTLKMIKSVPGISGVYRRQLARTYLKLSHFTHPSLKALRACMHKSCRALITSELKTVINVVDFIIYLASHHVPKEHLFSIRLEKLQFLGLTRSYKYLTKLLAISE